MLRDDLYAGAIRVVVEGRIEGDLIAFAAEEVIVRGSVGGSIYALTPRVRVDGTVEGSVRAIGSNVTIGGRVAGDVVTAAIEINLEADSTVDGEVLAWGWSLRSLGEIDALTGTQRTAELAGVVRTDIDISVDQLRIVDELEVGGDLGYRSDSEAEGLEMVTLGGVVVDKDPLPPNIRIRALTLFARFLLVLLLTISALVVSWGWPEQTAGAVDQARSTPARSWTRGAFVVFSPLILVGVAALIFALAPPAASFPLLAIFAPLVVAASGLVGAAALIAGVPVAGWVGATVFKRLSLPGAVLAGSVVMGLAWLMPWVGWLVPLGALPLGLGAWMKGWRREAVDVELVSSQGSDPARGEGSRRHHG